MKHKFKSIDGAVRRIRQLEKAIDTYEEICGELKSRHSATCETRRERSDVFKSIGRNAG
jgi:hypothetical protein